MQKKNMETNYLISTVLLLTWYTGNIIKWWVGPWCMAEPPAHILMCQRLHLVFPLHTNMNCVIDLSINKAGTVL